MIGVFITLSETVLLARTQTAIVAMLCLFALKMILERIKEIKSDTKNLLERIEARIKSISQNLADDK